MDDGSTSSGLVAASAAVTTRPARLMSLMAISDGTNAATIIVYDNKSAASGTVLAKVLVPAAVGTISHTIDSGVLASNGLYCSVSGTGAAAILHYQPE